MSEEYAYIAGLFDGEGCVDVIAGGKSRPRAHQLRVGFDMADPEPVAFLQEHYGGTIRKRVRTGSRRPLFCWFITGRRALEFLEDILPYSLGKQRQVAEALRFPWSGYQYGKGRPMPPEIAAKRQAVKDNLHMLKEPRADA